MMLFFLLYKCVCVCVKNDKIMCTNFHMCMQIIHHCIPYHVISHHTM